MAIILFRFMGIPFSKKNQVLFNFIFYKSWESFITSTTVSLSREFQLWDSKSKVLGILPQPLPLFLVSKNGVVGASLIFTEFKWNLRLLFCDSQMPYKTGWPGKARQREMEWAFYFSLQTLRSHSWGLSSQCIIGAWVKEGSKQQSKLEIGMGNY